jgi:hypothetical protein
MSQKILTPALGASIVFVGVAAGIGASSTAQSAADLSGLVASDRSVSQTNCTPSDADTSGLFGWYTPAQELVEPVFSPTEDVLSVKMGGNTMAITTDEKIHILERPSTFAKHTVVNTYPSLPQGGTIPNTIELAPDGSEFTIHSQFLNGGTGIYRKGANGWEVAQSLNFMTRPAYNQNGQRLAALDAVTVPSQVSVYSRAQNGSWELFARVQAPKGLSISTLGWSNDRLVFGDNAITYVFRPTQAGTVAGYELSQAIPGRYLYSQRAGDSIFMSNSSGFVSRLNQMGVGTGFTTAWTAPTGFVNVSSLTGPVSGFLNTLTSAGNPCGGNYVVSIQQSPALSPPSFYPLPGSGPVSAAGFVLDTAGVFAVVNRLNPTNNPRSSLYLIAQDRIFGGQNPQPGTNATVGQGGFE